MRKPARKAPALTGILPAEHPENDILAIYTRDVARHPLLTPAQEQDLGVKALAGDEDAQQQLVVHNLRFVIVQAKKYLNQGLPLMDLIQAGNMGLAHAARKFDPRRGVKFISYAVYWIQQSIQKEIDATNGTIRATQTQMVRLRRVRKLQAQARQKLGRDLTTYEVMRLTGYTSDRVNEAGDYRVSIKSLDEPVGGDESSSLTLGQMLSDPEGGQQQLREMEVREALEFAFRQLLTERERDVICEYYGIGTRKPLSLSEIGDGRDISRERVRQIKERVQRKLRQAPPEVRERLEEVFTSKRTIEERRTRLPAHGLRRGYTPELPVAQTSGALAPEVLRAFAHEERVHAEAAELAAREGWELPAVKRAVAPAGKPVLHAKGMPRRRDELDADLVGDLDDDLDAELDLDGAVATPRAKPAAAAPAAGGTRKARPSRAKAKIDVKQTAKVATGSRVRTVGHGVTPVAEARQTRVRVSAAPVTAKTTAANRKKKKG